MGPRTFASRLAGPLITAVLLAGSLGAPGAAAQSGTGLYEPFPEAAVKKRAQRYVERLRGRTPQPERRYSDAELSDGVFVRPDPRVPALSPSAAESAGAASARAGAGTGASLDLSLQLLALALALAIPFAVFHRREEPRAA